MRPATRVPIVASMLATAFLATLNISDAAAQFGDRAMAPTYGWIFNPSIKFGPEWDNNVLVQSVDDSPVADVAFAVAPVASLDFIGRKNEFSLGYSGSFSRYRLSQDLNTFEQSQRMSVKRRLSPHTTVSAFESYLVTPTTATPELVGAPFARIGARIATAGVALDAALNKHTAMTGSYNYQKTLYNDDPQDRPFVGGLSNNARVGLRRAMSNRFTATTDFDLVRTALEAGGTFKSQNASLGADYRLNERTNVFVSAGASRIDAPDLVEPRVLPSLRTGIRRAFNPAGIEATYGRSYVPSQTGGGTQANDEISIRLMAPLARRLYTTASVAWRRDSVIIVDDAPLKSVWVTATVGYSLRPWMRMEGFYSGLSQRIDRPGGDVFRQRVGVQFSTGAPMRIH